MAAGPCALVATGFFLAVRAPLAQGTITGLITNHNILLYRCGFFCRVGRAAITGRGVGHCTYGASGFVSNLLSLRPVRWIGMISFALSVALADHDLLSDILWSRSGHGRGSGSS